MPFDILRSQSRSRGHAVTMDDPATAPDKTQQSINKQNIMSGRTGERSNGGRSSMSGRNGGRGGRGRSSNRGGGRGGGGGGAATFSSPSNKPKLSKQDRKAGKRAKQLEAMDKKAKEEDAYFRKCQQEASRQQRNSISTNQSDGAKTQAELFSKQGTHGINFNKYDEIKVEVKLPPGSINDKISALQSFDELKLPPQLATNVGLMNYKLPTPIQRNAVPLCMAGEDLMCCAQTGSGKTCAFLLPICAALASGTPTTETNGTKQDGLQPACPSCVVLAPTRELASQIELEAQKLTFHIPNVSPVVVYGGAPAKSQLRDLAFACSKTALIVVATPGRLTDFVDRDIISLSNVQFLVLDEGDRMLDMGFM